MGGSDLDARPAAPQLRTRSASRASRAGSARDRSRSPRGKGARVPRVAMIGSGEYTTGYNGGAGATDKTKGVVGVVMFDLRRRGKVGEISCCGVNGKKWPEVRQHVQRALGEYAGLDLDMKTFPADDRVDADAYKLAINQLSPGDCITIFTPDDTHFEIAMYAIERGVHVMVTKPAVMTVQAHLALEAAAKRHNVHVQVELHKRWDPIYSDARERMRNTMGEFQYYNSYMSQPKFQLETFKAWAGKTSDISYYLNSHHIDMHCWAMQGRAVPVRVCALGATGTAEAHGCPKGTEDAITLMTEWRNEPSGTRGVATYTASWAAPNHGEVHSQQRFMCVGSKGEVRVDQGHRGYEGHYDGSYKSLNPLFMRYTPDEEGFFAGQRGYGYLSFEAFIDACTALNRGEKTREDLQRSLPTIENTKWMTAILEAGRRSLDADGAWVDLQPLIEGVPQKPLRYQPADGRVV